MKADQKIFQIIPRSSDRDQLLADFANQQCDIFIKFPGQKAVLTKVKKWLPPFKLQLNYPTSIRPLVQTQLPVQINYRGDRFFAQAFILDTGTEFFIVIEGPLYKVQRRQSFRLRLPFDYPAQVEVFELNGHRMEDRAKLIDISEGGCNLKVPHSLQCEMGSHIGLKMKIGSRPEFIEYGHIRYSKVHRSELEFGIRFIKVPGSHPELFNLVRELYAELFSKWYRRR